MSGCNDYKSKDGSTECPIVNRLEAIAIDLKTIFNQVKILDESYRGLFNDYNHLEDAIVELRDHAKETADHDERIDDLESISAETRLLRLESDHIGQQLDPKVWVFIQKRMDELESVVTMMSLELKAKEFGADMEKGDRWMECLIGVEIKLQSQIDEAKSQFKSICGKKPYKCPVCEGKTKCYVEKDCELSWECLSCDGEGIVWG